MKFRSQGVTAAVVAAFVLAGAPTGTARAQAQAKSDSIAAAARSVVPEKSLVVGGLIHAQADAGDQGDERFSSAHDRFYLRRARLSASGRLQQYFDFRLELEVAGSLGEVTGLRAQATDVYGEWTRFSSFRVRVGQFKTPFGFEQLVSDPRLFTVERSLANDRLTLGRQIGVQFSGQVPDAKLSWAGGLFNGTGTGTTANDNDNFLYVSRLAGTPLEEMGTLAWSVAVNGYVSHDDMLAQPPVFGFDSTPGGANDNIFRGRRWGFGADTQIQVKQFDVWLEYLRAFFESDSGVPLDLLKAEGGYAQVATFLIPARLQGLVRHDVFRPNLDQDLVARSWYLGVNGLVSGNAVKLQLGHLLTRLAPAGDTEGKTLARLQVVF